MDFIKNIFLKLVEPFDQKISLRDEFWEIRKSLVHGDGVFTKINIPKNTLIFAGLDERIKSQKTGIPLVLYPGPLVNHCIRRENIRLIKQGPIYRFITLVDIPTNSELIMNYNYTPEYISKPDPKFKSC
jgi:hypothetical protein